MFQQVITIIRGSWFPQNLLKWSVLWAYMDYGLSRVVSCQGMLVTSFDNWPLWTGRNPHISKIQTAWVASEETTTPWWWQWLAKTCWGKSRNALIKSCYFLDTFVGCFITILQRCSVHLSREHRMMKKVLKFTLLVSKTQCLYPLQLGKCFKTEVHNPLLVRV
jgi:hypothetical protein